MLAVSIYFLYLDPKNKGPSQGTLVSEKEEAWCMGSLVSGAGPTELEHVLIEWS